MYTYEFKVRTFVKTTAYPSYGGLTCVNTLWRQTNGVVVVFSVDDYSYTSL